MRQALLISIWQLSAILLLTSSPLKLCQVGWGRHTFSGFSRNIWLGSSSGLWLGHSVTFTELSIATLAVCLGPLSCWKVNLLPSLRFWMLWTGFSLRLSLYFSALSFFSSTLTSPSVPAAEKQPHEWGCYQHTLLLGWYSACDEQCLLSFKHDAWNWGSSDQIILFLTVWGSFRCFHVSTLKRGLSLATLP